MKYAHYWIFSFLALSAGIATTVAVGQVIMDRASTVGESYARGASDIIRSRGDANLSNSQAAINAQDAYSRSIDNSVKSVEAYWERKDIYASRKADEMYELGRKRQRRLERTGLKSLTSDEFDRTSGEITWPGPLKQAQYDEYRQEFELAFQKRAQEGWLGSDDYLEVKTASKEWRGMLAGQKELYPKKILSQMTRFILKLNRELNENLS